MVAEDQRGKIFKIFEGDDDHARQQVAVLGGKFSLMDENEDF